LFPHSGWRVLGRTRPVERRRFPFGGSCCLGHLRPAGPRTLGTGFFFFLPRVSFRSRNNVYPFSFRGALPSGELRHGFFPEGVVHLLFVRSCEHRAFAPGRPVWFAGRFSFMPEHSSTSACACALQERCLHRASRNTPGRSTCKHLLRRGKRQCGGPRSLPTATAREPKAGLLEGVGGPEPRFSIALPRALVP
jgi:hypothetical protein